MDQSREYRVQEREVRRCLKLSALDGIARAYGVLCCDLLVGSDSVLEFGRLQFFLRYLISVEPNLFVNFFFYTRVRKSIR